MKKSNIKFKIGTLAIVSAAAFSCFAQPSAAAAQVSQVPATTTGVPSQEMAKGMDVFMARKAIASKGYETMPILFYQGTAGGQDKHSLLTNFLPLSNALSEVTKTNTVLMFEKNWKGLEKSAKDYDLILVPSLLVPDFVRSGFFPLVRHSDDDVQFVGAMVVLESSKITKLEDLRGKKISWSENSQIGQQMRYNLVKSNVVPTNSNFVDAGGSGQSGLKPTLDSGAVDAVLVRKSIAAKWIEETPNAYKVISESYRAPGFTLMIKSSKKDTPFAKQMADAWQTVTSDTIYKEVNAGLKRGAGLTGHFVPAKLEDFRFVDEANKVAETVWTKK